jgi:hypothetical protein
MPARAFVIRFPNGDFEYDFTRRTLPSIGDTMRRNGLLWLVTRITQDRVVTVHVEHVDDRDPSSESSPGTLSESRRRPSWSFVSPTVRSNIDPRTASFR